MAKCLSPVALPGAAYFVPCGKCVNCCVNYSKEWAVRCLDELKVNNGVGCFLTLTYAETDGALHRDELQRFIKRLRSAIAPQRVRYFYCGEYGGKGNRPHYHMLLFGWRPADLEEVSSRGNTKYYKSEFVAKLWKQGFVSVGDITLESAMYCAKYLQKLDEREHPVRPFVGMSLKPGLGVGALEFKDLMNEKRYIKGKSYSLPRYYINKAEKEGVNVDSIRLHRKQVAASLSYPGVDYERIAECAVEKRQKMEVLNRKRVKTS